MTTFEAISQVIDRIIHDADKELALAITSGAGTPEARTHMLVADGLQRAVRIAKEERQKYRNAAPHTGDVCLDCGALIEVADLRSSSPGRCAKCREDADRKFFGGTELNGGAYDATPGKAGTIPAAESNPNGRELSLFLPGSLMDFLSDPSAMDLSEIRQAFTLK